MGSSLSKDASSPPPPPDPMKAAKAQTDSNLTTAIAQGLLNRTSQTSPYGSSVYKQSGTVDIGNGYKIPTYEQNVTLSPNQQALLTGSEEIGKSLLDTGQQQLGRVRESLATPLDFSNLPKSLSEAYGADPRQRVEDAVYKRSTSRLDPQYDVLQRRLETKLANQGFARGNEGYTNAVDDFERNRADAYANARNDAIAQGGTEQSREAALRQSERGAALSELLTKRSQPLNELVALEGASPGVTNAQYQAPPQTGVAGTNVVDAIYNSANLAQKNYMTQQQSGSDTLSSLAGLAGTLGKAWIMSDPDAKTDKHDAPDAKILEKVRQLPVDTYRYKGTSTKRVGPMADDWASKFGGDGNVIAAPQAFGVTLSAIKALADEVAQLKANTAKGRVRKAA